jgi:hypothetical protein
MPSGARRTQATDARDARPLDAGPFAADIASFRLHLAAEGKSASSPADAPTLQRPCPLPHLRPRLVLAVADHPATQARQALGLPRPQRLSECFLFLLLGGIVHTSAQPL